MAISSVQIGSTPSNTVQKPLTRGERTAATTDFLNKMRVGRDDASAGKFGVRLDDLTEDEIRRVVFGSR